MTGPGAEQRVLVLAPSGADAEVIDRLLRAAGLGPWRCPSVEVLVETLNAGAAAAIVSEEALGARALELFTEALAAQPEWSDLPLILLTLPDREMGPLVDHLWWSAHGHVSVLERPVYSSTLLAAVHAALRSRARQYQVRDELARRREAELALRESQERLRRAQRAGRVGVWELDVATLQTTWSREMWELYGRTPDPTATPEEVFLSSLHGEDASRVRERIAGCIAGEQDQLDEEFRIVRPDGAVRWIQTIAQTTRSAGSQAVKIAGVSIDTTDRKQAEQALHEASIRKNEFLAMLGHELRNPLASLRMSLEIVRRSADSATLAETRRIMERQTEHLTRLVDDLLDVSRITHGKLNLQATRVALSTVISSAIKSARAALDEAGHELVAVLPEEPVFVKADPMRLAQVFTNLLNNATRYTPDGGHIELRMETEGDRVRVSVRDDGIGIPEGKTDRLFEMFEQLDRSLETGFKGLGIGLALARSLVELHGGSIEAFSEGEGQGSEFTVWLPVAAPGETGPDHGAPAAVRAVQRSVRHRVLVVEDNHDAASTLVKLLQMFGHEVEVAGDGLAALDAVAAFRPHLVLLDIGLPGLNGYEVARRVRAEHRGQDLLLVALTGWGQDRDRQRAREAGFDHHLTKPADLVQLQNVLDSVAPHEDEADSAEGSPVTEPAAAPVDPEKMRRFAHDLRGALNSLLLQVNLLAVEVGDRLDFEDFARQLRQGGERIARQVERLAGHAAPSRSAEVREPWHS